ncbi:hypothetical protein [Cellulomonas timonensis]|uniref:hypothetical protein n=1 Tax=Cellulomonas timonensis TaxID=1689271 RepID=UPI00083176CC|nr:hypothetical protein [Cellulomonas timonensis]
MQSLLKIFTPVAGLGVVATILSALLAVPSFVGEGPVLSPGMAVGAMGGLCVVGVLAGVLLRLRTSRSTVRGEGTGRWRRVGRSL